MNLGGGGYSELRLHHCTPAWVAEQDSISNKQNKNNSNNKKRIKVKILLLSLASSSRKKTKRNFNFKNSGNFTSSKQNTSPRLLIDL